MSETILVSELVERFGTCYKCTAVYVNGLQYLDGYYQKCKSLIYTVNPVNVTHYKGIEKYQYLECIASERVILHNGFRLTKSNKEYWTVDFNAWVKKVIE